MKVEQIYTGDDSVDVVVKSKGKALRVNEFECIAGEEDALILDTRSARDFAKGFIPKSINIGIYGSFEIWTATLIADVKQPILFIADEGFEQKVIKRLSRAGYDNVLGYLEGSIVAWKIAGKVVESIPSVAVEKLVEEKVNNAEINILDVRKYSEYLSGHVLNVNCAPLDNINESMLTVDKNNKCYVYCADGYRSMIFASILKTRGFNNLIDVEGGFKAIKESGKFIITDFICPTSRL
jgi:hydroxyacylglutathione hydrolase